MATWSAVRDALVRQFEIEADDGDLLLLVLRDGPRRQDIFVTHHPGTTGPPWVKIEAGFGDMTPDALKAGLGHVDGRQRGRKSRRCQ